MYWSLRGDLLRRKCGPMLLHPDDWLLLLDLFGECNVLFLLLIDHGQEHLFVDHDLLVCLFGRRLQEDLSINTHLRINSILGILLLLGIVRRLGPLLLGLDKLDRYFLVRFNLLIGYYLREGWLQL